MRRRVPRIEAAAEAVDEVEDDEDDDEVKKPAEPETETSGFVLRDDDEDDAPAQQVVTAGATADPVMSVFIVTMPSRGLSASPPVS